MTGGGNGLGYWIAMFALGGTNVWTIVLYFLEKGKRKVEEKSAIVDVEHKEFETMRDQFAVFDERLENYSRSLIEAENLIENLKQEKRDMQKDKFNMEMKILQLEHLVKQKEENECLDKHCQHRIKKS